MTLLAGFVQRGSISIMAQEREVTRDGLVFVGGGAAFLALAVVEGEGIQQD